MDRRFVIEDRTRRNRNFRVSVVGAEQYLVKQGQPDPGETTTTVEREARMLRAIQHLPAFERIRWFTPALIDYDKENAILTTELITPATSLTKFHLNLGKIHFPKEVGQTVGSFLGHLHNAGAEAIAAKDLGFLPRQRPWPWTLRASREGASGPVREYLAAVAARGVFADPDLAGQAYDEVPGLVHGDIRWDNFVLTSGSGRAGVVNLRLIDFELVRVGDPLWDVACYLAEYFRFWFMTTIAKPTEGLEDVKRNAFFKLEETHPSARALLDSYARRRGWAGAKRDEMKARLRLYLPYACVLVGSESLQRQTSVTGVARVSIDLAARVREDPAGATREWFGF